MLLEGPGFDQVTQHSQALGVLTGRAQRAGGPAGMLYALSGEEVLPCTFPWQFTLLRALDAVGLYDRTAPVWDQYFEMLERNLTTVPERPGRDAQRLPRLERPAPLRGAAHAAGRAARRPRLGAHPRRAPRRRLDRLSGRRAHAQGAGARRLGEAGGRQFARRGRRTEGRAAGARRQRQDPVQAADGRAEIGGA